MEIDKNILDKIKNKDKPKQENKEVAASSESVTEQKLDENYILSKKKRDSLNRSYGLGGRKSAKARVWIKPGKGKFEVNRKAKQEYFKRPVLDMITSDPFKITNTLGMFDVYATVKGSGLSGQAGAIRHAISRALTAFDPEAYYKILKSAGFLTRDQRKVERKKYGQPKARKKFQFSKR